MKTSTNPGSDAAIDAGCKCPVMDNSYGKGYYMQPGVFVFRQGCPIHWPEGQEKPSLKVKELKDE